eukprot:3895327-Rhodomonas_salina.2
MPLLITNQLENVASALPGYTVTNTSSSTTVLGIPTEVRKTLAGPARRTCNGDVSASARPKSVTRKTQVRKFVGLASTAENTKER